MPHWRQRTGQSGEDAAARHLTERGLRIVARNWRCRLGELDLVALEGATVIFVEVKAWRSRRFGPAAAAVDSRKQGRLVRLAQAFLQVHGWEGRSCRFDVVALAPAAAGGWTVDWIRDAFRL